MAMDLVTVTLVCLGTARLTRLVTTDKVTEPLRNLAARKMGIESLATYFLFCDWCVSIYTGAAVAGAWWLSGGATWFTAATLALSASYVAGLLGSLTDGE